VDFDNDCVGTSLAVARALGDRLYGVRLDTSENAGRQVGHSADGDVQPTGVNPELVAERAARARCRWFSTRQDRRLGRLHRGEDPSFEEQDIPSTSTASGRASFQGRFDFTPDVVMVEGSRARGGQGVTARIHD